MNTLAFNGDAVCKEALLEEVTKVMAQGGFTHTMLMVEPYNIDEELLLLSHCFTRCLAEPQKAYAPLRLLQAIPVGADTRDAGFIITTWLSGKLSPKAAAVFSKALDLNGARLRTDTAPEFAEVFEKILERLATLPVQAAAAA